MTKHPVLPDYLQFSPDASPNQEAGVLCGDVRITVITSRLIRIERGVFTDAATLISICQNFVSCTPVVTQQDGIWRIGMSALTLNDRA